MKTNQDGGSVTASDPAAAGKEMAANQEGAAKTYGGNKGDESAKTKAKVKAVKKDAPKDYEGGARMGYSQKFGAGRMNGYDAGAKKVMDVMTYGAGKYMEDGPAQMKRDIKSGGRVNVDTSDGKKLSVKSGSGFHQQALNQGSVIQSMRPDYPMGDPYEANISKEEKNKRKKATYPKN